MARAHKIALIKTVILKCWLGFVCWKKSRMTGKISYSDPVYQGHLPIRVLQRVMLNWFETSSKDFLARLLEQIRVKGLKRGIKWDDSQNPIISHGRVYAASINSKNQIVIHETFCAYLWSMSYHFLVLFDEAIQIPQLKGTYNGSIDSKNKQVDAATNLYAYAMIIRNRYTAWNDSDPNPEKVCCKFSYYVDKTNGIFTSAMFFIFAHEVGHNHFGHTTYTPATDEDAVRDEWDADNYAIDQVLSCSAPERLTSLKYGALLGVIALLFLSGRLTSRTHPDADDRINNVMGRLGFDDMSLAWGIASLGLKFWADENRINLNLPPVYETYRDMYYHTMQKFAEMKAV